MGVWPHSRLLLREMKSRKWVEMKAIGAGNTPVEVRKNKGGVQSSRAVTLMNRTLSLSERAAESRRGAEVSISDWMRKSGVAEK